MSKARVPLRRSECALQDIQQLARQVDSLSGLVKERNPAAGLEEAREIREHRRLGTGCAKLDSALFNRCQDVAGIFAPASMVAISGEAGSGKSALCASLCLQAALPREVDGACRIAVYLDTEGDSKSGLGRLNSMFRCVTNALRTSRDEQKRQLVDSPIYKATLNRIMRPNLRIRDASSMLHFVETILPRQLRQVVRSNIPKHITSKKERKRRFEEIRQQVFGIIVVDSMAAVVRASFVVKGRGTKEGFARAQTVRRITEALSALASFYACPVVVVNHAVANFELPNNRSLQIDSENSNTGVRPALGPYWSRQPSRYLLLGKTFSATTGQRQRILRVARCQSAPVFEVPLDMCSSGLHHPDCRCEVRTQGIHGKRPRSALES